ncbi:putative phosphatase regulatory subunit-domain-containing protein [Russula brevipes]|nr:putative phosphatase regulatory subunit-domain-containing protein [Russula brevipes]
MPYVASRSPVTFSNERGPGAFAPLNSLPRRSNSKKSLFHIPNDDDNDQQEESTPPPSPPRVPTNPPRVDTPSVPFPTASPVSVTTPKSSSQPIQRTSSSSSVILSNGRPLKPSLKSASSSSIPDDMAASGSRHARAQSMPSPPAYGPKNVHFKEKEDGLESVRLFRRTGKPVSVSKPTSDTETETEPEPSSAFSFPRISSGPSGSSLSEIANCSPVPATNPSPYANVHLESVALPPARPPVLRGTVLVRNVVFEKHVGVRFTLDDWTTVSEVLASYAGPVGVLETLAGSNQGKTVGDLIGSSAASRWDRFNFAIKLEDYESYLWQRTLFVVVRYTAPGVGEFWDNNSGKNYRLTFRPHTGPVQPERKRGTSAPSPTPFLLSATPTSPLASPVSVHHEPRPTFSPPQRPPLIPRSASSPIPATGAAGIRLNLRHYAAPAPPPRIPLPLDLPLSAPPSGAPRVIPDAQPTTPTPEAPGLVKVPSSGKDDVDEGFATGSEDGDVAETRATPRPNLLINISPATPAVARQVSPVSPTPSPPPRQQGPFSPVHGPFSPRSRGGADESTYAVLIREWCFAQGPDSFGAGTAIGAQSAVPWVGGMS